MTQRRERLERLKGVREKALDDKVALLSRARHAVTLAQQAQQVETERLQQAQAARSTKAAQASTIQEWTDANDWLATCEAGYWRAVKETRQAERSLQLAQRAVLTARSDLDKMQRLCAKLATQEQIAGDRAEQRLLDELSGNISRQRVR